MLPRCVGRSGVRHALTAGGRAATIPAPRWSTPSAGRRSGPVAAGSPLSLDSAGSMSMATKTKRQSRAALRRPPLQQALLRSSSAPLCSQGGLYGLHLVTSLCPSWPGSGRSRHSSGLVDALLDALRRPPLHASRAPAVTDVPLSVEATLCRHGAGTVARRSFTWGGGEATASALPVRCGSHRRNPTRRDTQQQRYDIAALKWRGTGIVAHTTPPCRPLGRLSRSDSRGARGDDPRSSLVYSVGREALGAGGRWQPALTGPQRGFSRFDAHGDENKAAVARCFASPAYTAGAFSILQRAAVLVWGPVWPPSRRAATASARAAARGAGGNGRHVRNASGPALGGGGGSTRRRSDQIGRAHV